MHKSGRLLIALLAFVSLAASAAAHVSLDYPIGGETFTAGEIVTVQWHILVQHDQEDWDLYFSSDGGTTYDPIELDLPVEQLQYDWTVPDVLTEQGRIKIVQDNTGTDYSDSSGNFTIEEASTGADEHAERPGTLELLATRPNPFSDTTAIRFALPVAGAVDLAIYGRSGQRVRTLLSAQRPAGDHSVQWDGRDEAGQQLPGGTYVCRLTTGSFSAAREIVLLR
jgi:hypothetical protein